MHKEFESLRGWMGGFSMVRLLTLLGGGVGVYCLTVNYFFLAKIYVLRASIVLILNRIEIS